MSKIRKKGLTYLHRFVSPDPSGSVAVSRFYPPNKSWTKKSAWWFDLPINRIRDKKAGHYFLLGERKRGEFVILKVANKFLLTNLKKFETRYQEKIRLHLAAEGKNRLVDERGKGRVDFSHFEQKM